MPYLDENTEKIVSECTVTVLEQILSSLGRRNVIRVYLTGSVARNHATFVSIGNRKYLESDLDLVVVVRKSALVKSLLLVKNISNHLTRKLRDFLIKSHVSISIATSKSLSSAPPSIFLYDLLTNGKIIYGTTDEKKSPVFTISEIPSEDVYRLLFNRMAEALQSLIVSRIFSVDGKNEHFKDLYRAIKKLNFALIQSIMINEGMLIYGQECVNDLDPEALNDPLHRSLIKSLVDNYLQLVTNEEKFTDTNTEYITSCWKSTIVQFNSTLSTLSQFKDTDYIISKRVLFHREQLMSRLKLSGLMIMQYLSSKQLDIVFRSSVFCIIYGPDCIYYRLYEFFLSTPSMLEQYSHSKNPSHNYIVDIPKLETWLRRLTNYIVVWQLKTGG